MCGTEQSKEFEASTSKDRKFAKFMREEKFIHQEFYKTEMNKQNTIFRKKNKKAFKPTIESVIIKTTSVKNYWLKPSSRSRTMILFRMGTTLLVSSRLRPSRSTPRLLRIARGG